MSAGHTLDDVSEDDEGWWWCACSCDWQHGPFPGREDATDAFNDHLDVVAQDGWA